MMRFSKYPELEKSFWTNVRKIGIGVHLSQYKNLCGEGWEETEGNLRKKDGTPIISPLNTLLG